MLEKVTEGMIFVDKQRNAIKVLVTKDNKTKWQNLHRLVYAVANNIKPKDIDGDIHHINLNPFDNRPLNLSNLTKEEHRTLHKLLRKCKVDLGKKNDWK